MAQLHSIKAPDQDRVAILLEEEDLSPVLVVSVASAEQVVSVLTSISMICSSKLLEAVADVAGLEEDRHHSRRRY